VRYSPPEEKGYCLECGQKGAPGGICRECGAHWHYPHTREDCERAKCERQAAAADQK
jgi:hypothetical protein